jgi:hypothetical protein
MAGLGEDLAMSQHLDALKHANEIRVGRSIVKRKLRNREITLSEALREPCCATATIYSMLCAQRGWGDVRAHGFLSKLANHYAVPVGASRTVKELTGRQLATLSAALGERVV